MEVGGWLGHLGGLASVINLGQSVPIRARQKTAKSSDRSGNGTSDMFAAVTQELTATRSKDFTAQSGKALLSAPIGGMELIGRNGDNRDHMDDRGK